MLGCWFLSTNVGIEKISSWFDSYTHSAYSHAGPRSLSKFPRHVPGSVYTLQPCLSLPHSTPTFHFSPGTNLKTNDKVMNEDPAPSSSHLSVAQEDK